MAHEFRGAGLDHSPTDKPDFLNSQEGVVLDRDAGPVAFGNYELLELLAVGGMAEIYRARALMGLTRDCVIKRILPRFSSDRQFVSMFIDEARITVGLEHPHIVRLFDFGQVDGSYFMAMEHVDGVDLVAVLRAVKARGVGVPPAIAATIAAAVCAGLHHAHTAADHRGLPLGIVHRDISPQNVFLGRDGTVKVGDFGIASARNKLTRTMPGTVKGKFGYMSPEQATGGAIDARSDIWACGVVFAEMLLGARLFAAESPLHTLARIVESAVTPPSLRRPEVPPALDAIVLKALTRPVDQRYATAAAMETDLRAWLARQKDPHGPEAFRTWLETLSVRRDPEEVRKKTPVLVTHATSMPADSVLRTLRGELKSRQNLWTLVDIAERHAFLGQRAEAIAAVRVAASVFAHRGLLVQAVCAMHTIKPILTADELENDLYELAQLRGHDRARLLAYIARVDTPGFFPLVREADPGGLGKENTEDTLVRYPAPLFGRVSPADFVRLAGFARIDEHEAGAVLVRESEPGDSLYAIGRGRVVVHTTPRVDGTDGADAVGQSGERVYVAALGEGDFFGEISLLTTSMRSATVEAQSPVVTLRLDRDDLDRLMRSDPRFREPLQDFYKERVAELVLAQNPVFSVLPADERRRLLQRSPVERFADDETIVREGEVANTFYFVMSGEVEVVREQDGFPVFINKLREGQFFGEMAALRGTPRTATVVAMGDVEALVVSREELEALLDENAELRQLFERAMCAREAEASERVAETHRIFSGV